ncbi:MAG TPA: hypothetical protein VMC83_00275 [Streptosporangiaceae bacterium]|nr:hypothetical protein [Streptosporangiaceae bacterium]
MVDEALSAHGAFQLLLTAYPDDRQRERAVDWLGPIACQMGDGERLTLSASSPWIPQRWLTDARWLVAVLAAFALSGLGYLTVPRWPFTLAPLILAFLFLIAILPIRTRSTKLAELAVLIHRRKWVRLRRLLAEATERGIMRQGRSGYQFADPSLRAVLAASYQAHLAERVRSRADLAARPGSRARLVAFLTDTRLARIVVDFGLGGGIAFYIWRLQEFSHPWGGRGGRIFFFVIVVWGAGMLAAAAPLIVLATARDVSRWTLANVPDLSRWQRLVLTLAAVAAAAAAIATTWTPVVAAVTVALPAAFVAACGLWACVLASRIARRTARRWPKALPDVIGAATAAGSLLLVVKHNLLTTEPAAGFLFPLAVWVSIRAWLAMKRSRHLTARAGADLTLSLLLGAELVLFLVWLANLLGMSRPEVAALRAILARAGAVVDLPWWFWTTLYVLLAALSLAFVLRPAATARLRRWFARLRVRSVADVTRRLLSGVHIALLAIVLVALAAPAALGPALQRRVASAYTVALQRQFEAQGELAAYTEIRHQFTGTAAPQSLIQVVTEIHDDSSPPPGDDNATPTEDQVALRVGVLQAATLGLGNAQALRDTDAALAKQAGLDVPVDGEPELAHRLGEVQAQDQNEDEAQSSAEQAGDLAAKAIASTISIANIGGNETFQIVREYLGGLVEESSLKDTFAEWAGRLAGGTPPDADAMVIPDPGKLEHAAHEELVREFAAEGDAGEISDDQAVSNALQEPPIDAAVILASQSLQVGSGYCAACTPSAPDDQPPEPPSGDDG